MQVQASVVCRYRQEVVQIVDCATLEAVTIRPGFGGHSIDESEILDAEDVAAAIRQHGEREIDSLAADRRLVADLDADRVDENDRIDRVQWARLPCRQPGGATRTAHRPHGARLPVLRNGARLVLSAEAQRR